MRMRLAPADEAGERFAAVNAGLGISAIELIGGGDQAPLTQAYHLFRRLDLGGSLDAPDRLAVAFAAWHDALARAGLRLRRERTALYGAPLQHGSWASPDRGISIRPWDIELTAIEAGLRQVVKLDRVPDDFVDVLRQEATQRGLFLEIVAPPVSDVHGATTLLLSNDPAALAEAGDLERQLIRRGGDQGPAAAMGELLGYPSCCVRRFARVVEHNDTTLAWALLPEPHTPAKPFTQWLQPGLALLSHSPCGLDCAASIALGRKLLDALEAREGGMAARWRSLATRVQAVDQRGNRVALAVEGPLGDAPSVVAADLLASSGSDPDAVARAANLVGQKLHLEDGGLVISRLDWWAPYVADHRAEG